MRQRKNLHLFSERERDKGDFADWSVEMEKAGDPGDV